MIRGRENKRSNIDNSFVGSNRTNGRREGIPRVEPEFVKSLEFREVLLEFWEISKGALW